VPGAPYRVDVGSEGEWVVLDGFSAPHRFGTSRFLAESTRSIDHEPVLTVRQVHKDAVLAVPSRDRDPGQWQTAAAAADADGVATDRMDCWIGVTTADCVPLLLHDPGAAAVAAVHAGWRGALMGVATAALRMLVDRFGAEPSRMEAALGPHIGPCCFEVGRAVLEPLSRLREGERWVSRRHGEKGHLDLGGFVRWQLADAGVAPERIVALGLCTRCHPALFSSYRRDGERPRGMLSAVHVAAGA
jgi:YfiH family protein